MRDDGGALDKAVGLSLVRMVSAESNLEEFPFFLVSHSRAGREQEIVYERILKGAAHGGNERGIKQRWIVRASGSLGLPARMDQDVYMGVLEVLDDRGGVPEDGELELSLYELLEVLGWPQAGSRYERARTSLKRIAATSITSERAFYSKRAGAYLSDTFSLWSAHFAEYRGPMGRAAERHRLRFHPIFAESYRENYLNRLDSGFYWSLEHHTSKRLYRLLDRYCGQGARGRGRTWETDLFDLRDLVPLKEYRYASQVKRALGPAHDELIAKGFLGDVSYVSGKQHAPSELVLYRTSPTFSRRRLTQRVEENPANAIAVELLRAEGVRPDRATILVGTYGHERCSKWAELLPYQKDVRSKNRGGLLVWAIENEPPEWEERASRAESTGNVPRSEPGTEKNYDWLLGKGDARERTDASGVRRREEFSPTHQDTAVDLSTPAQELSAEEVWRDLVEAFLVEGYYGVSSGWFAPYIGHSVVEGVLTISAPDQAGVECIIERFGDGLSHAWRNRAGQNAKIRVGARATIGGT